MSIERLRQRAERRLDHAHAGGQAIGPILGETSREAIALQMQGKASASDVEALFDHLTRYTEPMRAPVRVRYSSRPPPRLARSRR